MIVYSPINGEVLTNAIKFYPRTAFVMTQLGTPLPAELVQIRKVLAKEAWHHDGLTMFDETYPNGTKPEWFGRYVTEFVLERID